MQNKYSPEYRKQRKWLLGLFIALLCALLLNSLAGDYFRKVFFNLLAALSPLLIGLALTFLFKKMLDFLETKVFYKWFRKLKNGKKVTRIFCITLLFLLLFCAIFFIIFTVIPNIVNFVNGLSGEVVNNFVNKIKTQLTQFFESTGWFNDVDIEVAITDFINKIGDTLTTNIPLIAQSIAEIIQQTATMLAYFIAGVVIAIIMLYRKEDISAFSKRLTYATLSEKRADRLIKTAKFADKTLYDYVIAKLLEAVLIFAILIPGFILLKVPSPAIMALLFAIINMIPYLGGVIGSILVCVFCIATLNVTSALWVLLYIVVLTNLYGYVVSPFLFGRRLQVSALLVIVSLLVFGSIFGILGMFFGPPIMAVIWKLLNQFIAEKENEKLELEHYGLTKEDVNDLEILQEASKIVKARRAKAKQTQNETNLADSEKKVESIISASEPLTHTEKRPKSKTKFNKDSGSSSDSASDNKEQIQTERDDKKIDG